MTELERVALWNTTAGKPCGCSNGSDELMQSQVGYLFEEAEELYAANRRSLEHSFLDACGDVLVVAGGIYHLVGATQFPRLPATGKPETDVMEELVDQLYFLTKSAKEDFGKIDPRSLASAAIGLVCDMLHLKGYDPEEILRIVNDSNFTKFCSTVEEAKLSRHLYAKKKRYSNVKYKKVGNYRVLYGDDTLHGTKGKTLKSCRFKEPCFLEVIGRVRPDLMGGKSSETN